MSKIISWDEYFMGVAHLSALRSKDPNTQVGACVVDKDNKIVTVGYNGMPRGVSDKEVPWNREGGFKDTKYAYVVHAELNAILNTPRSLKDCTLYVSLFPCNECAKAIIQSGIKKIVYESDKYDGTDANIVSKKMLNLAGVELVQLPYAVNVSLTSTADEFINDSELAKVAGGVEPYESDPRYIALYNQYKNLNDQLKKVSDPIMAKLLIESMLKNIEEMKIIIEEYKN